VLAVELRCSLANVLNHQGQYQRSVALLDEAEALARQLDDRVPMRRVLELMSWAHRDMGDLDGAIVAARQALEIASTLGDHVGQASASYRLAHALFHAGDPSRAADLLRGNVEALALGTPDPDGFLSSVNSRAWLGLVLAYLGEFAEGRRHGEEAVHLAMMRQGPSRISAHGCLGLLYLAKGDLEAAVRVLESGLAFARAAEERAWSSGMAGALGEAYGRAGRLAEGVALVEEALRDVGLRGVLRTQHEVARRLSAVYLLAGRLDEARQHACQALGLARQQKARGSEALSLFALGAAHSHASPPDVEQAETTYGEALALAEPRGMRPLVAHCHLGLGKLYRRTGKRQEAQGHLTTATSVSASASLRRASASLARVSSSTLFLDLNGISTVHLLDTSERIGSRGVDSCRPACEPAISRGSDRGMPSHAETQCRSRRA
jgi:tetratricopeptide (TPR) repeat protein